MIQIKEYKSPGSLNYIIKIDESLGSIKLQTIHTNSTAVTVRLYKNNYISFDFQTGIDFIEEAYRIKKISIFKTVDYLILKFVNTELQELQLDDLDIQDKNIKDKLRIYMKDWNIAYIKIHKDLLNYEDLDIDEIVYS